MVKAYVAPIVYRTFKVMLSILHTHPARRQRLASVVDRDKIRDFGKYLYMSP